MGGRGVELPPSPHTQIRVKVFSILHLFLVFLLLALNRQLFAGIVTIYQMKLKFASKFSVTLWVFSQKWVKTSSVQKDGLQ